MNHEGFPRWVEDELHNWSRWCWLGDWPHPLPPSRCASGERDYPSGQDREGDEPPPAVIPVMHERARAVNALYEALPLVERRIIQAEYPRRHEYGDMRMHERHAKAARKLDISLAYYRIALNSFKQSVWRAFK